MNFLSSFGGDKHGVMRSKMLLSMVLVSVLSSLFGFSQDVEVAQEVRDKFLVDPVEVSELAVKDLELAKKLEEITRVSPYLKKGDMKMLMHAFGVHDILSEKNFIELREGSIRVKGTRLFCMQCSRVLSALTLTNNLKLEEFSVLGAGFASGETEKYNQLLKKLGLDVHVDD